MMAPVRQRSLTKTMEIINNYMLRELHLNEIGFKTVCRLKLAINTKWVKEEGNKKKT